MCGEIAKIKKGDVCPFCGCENKKYAVAYRTVDTQNTKVVMLHHLFNGNGWNDSDNVIHRKATEIIKELKYPKTVDLGPLRDLVVDFILCILKKGRVKMMTLKPK